MLWVIRELDICKRPTELRAQNWDEKEDWRANKASKMQHNIITEFINEF